MLATLVTLQEGDQPKNFEVIDSSTGQRDHLAGGTAIGPIALGMTLADARRTLPSATFRRTSDGDGAALVEVILPSKAVIQFRAGEDDPKAPIDWARPIEVIETFDPSFETAGGIRVGTPVSAVEAMWGAVKEIVQSEIESREYAHSSDSLRSLPCGSWAAISLREGVGRPGITRGPGFIRLRSGCDRRGREATDEL